MAQLYPARSNLFSLPVALNQTRAPPIIHKISPNEGPKIGGIEVGVLGTAFFQGLEVWFGDQKATTTTFWGESSLVCLLPPLPVAGPVAVTFKHNPVAAQSSPMGQHPPTFKYIDDTEDKLMRAVLSVLSHKISGQMVNVSDLAIKVLIDASSDWSGTSSDGPSSDGEAFKYAPDLESRLLKCLNLIDLDDSPHQPRFELRSSTGHTMLHLSCSLGYLRFIAALLARGANPEPRDKGGFTPLHMAAIHNHPNIVRRLMLNGADSTIRSLSGLTAADVSQSRAVLRLIRRSERHIRFRSSGSSPTSLRSLWEPVTKVQAQEEPLLADSSEESSEHTSGDFKDEDPDENSYLSMRRPRGTRQDRDQPNLRLQNTGEPKGDDPAALKDDFRQRLQQFHQAIRLQFQNQQRMHQLIMPGLSGARPAPANEQPGGWDMAKSSGDAPPAYGDLFPQEHLDAKQESAAQAACEAEADMKCAILFNEPTASEAVATKTQVPKGNDKGKGKGRMYDDSAQDCTTSDPNTIETRGPHLDTFWITTFPKKLSEELRRPAGGGQRVIGWGIRVNESLNWSLILFSILIIFLLTTVGVIIYSTATSDSSSAFGLGAFLAALMTVYLTYQYFAWKEDV
ncbi:hypothetical protein ACJ41O_015365 [Fusarium nematophilum]